MSKKIIFILAIFICVASYGQIKNDSIILKEKFVSIKKVNRDLLNKNSEFLILENKDTLVLTKCHFPKFTYPNLATKAKTQLFKFKYQYIAFGNYTKKSNKKKLYLRQWNTPINVFIDRSIQKETRKKIERFILDISELNIPNLKIELVKNKKKSNYYISSTSEQLKILDEKKLDQYTEEQVRNRFKNNANYYLMSDNNKKIYSCNLKINLDSFENQNDILAKFKKLFFGSLGRFHSISSTTESLLYSKYENDETISSFDINILKTHYKYIYPFKVSYELFKFIEDN